jgi:hypothetical protein
VPSNDRLVNRGWPSIGSTTLGACRDTGTGVVMSVRSSVVPLRTQRVLLPP